MTRSEWTRQRVPQQGAMEMYMVDWWLWQTSKIPESLQSRRVALMEQDSIGQENGNFRYHILQHIPRWRLGGERAAQRRTSDMKSG